MANNVDIKDFTLGTARTMKTRETAGVNTPIHQLEDSAGGEILGVTTGAAVTTSAAGTIQQYLRGIVSLLVSGITVASHAVTNAGTFAVQVSSIAAGSNAIGKLAANSGVNIGTVTVDGTQLAPAATTPQTMSATFQLVDVPTDGTQATRIGAVTETAPASDTASSGLNGRLQRLAQNITTLIAATLKVALQAATSGGVSRSRTLIPNNTTAIVVKASAGQVYKIRATNNSGVIAYIKLYDATSATVGTGTPVDTIMIPANSSGGAGIIDTTDVGAVHAAGITYIVTTGITDADTAAPAAGAYVVTFFYK